MISNRVPNIGVPVTVCLNGQPCCYPNCGCALSYTPADEQARQWEKIIWYLNRLNKRRWRRI